MSTRTNIITNAIVNYLNLKGFNAWRQNNGGVYDPTLKVFRKKGKNEKQGVSDVIGYCKKTARFIAVEVKYGKDDLSPEQELFLKDVNKAGGIGIMVKSTDDFIKQFETVNKNISQNVCTLKK